MKFKHLHIENIRSYPLLDLDFEDGVTVISGVNGSGKSSILEACFMGLFGGKVLTDTKLNLADMIRKGSNHAEIILEFEHFGDNYRIEQQFKLPKTNTANAKPLTKSILFKNGENIAEQPTKTYEALVGLLNMDEKNFQNCAYIRQGDVDALINAKPADRQKMIDDLLRLGKLEDYRQRSHDSKTAVRRILTNEQDNQKKLQTKIEELRSKNLFGEVNQFKEAQIKIDGALQKKREEKDKYVTDLALLESKLKEIETAKIEIETLKKNISELRKKIDAEAEEKEKTMQQILAAEKNIDENDKAFKIVLSELAQLGRQIENNDDETGINAFLIQVREEEKKAVEERHAVSSKLNSIAVDKKNKMGNAAEKEKEQKNLSDTLSALEKSLQIQTKAIDDTNAAVESGYLKAEGDKKAFLDVFNDVVKQLNSERDEITGEEKTESEVCKNMSFLASVVQAAELPIPSNEDLWETTVSDIENLEICLLEEVQMREKRLIDAEKTKATIVGE